MMRDATTARAGILPDGLDDVRALIDAALEPEIEGISFTHSRDEYGMHCERDEPVSVVAGRMAQAVLVALYREGYTLTRAIPSVAPAPASLDLVGMCRSILLAP